ncbi:unnamed protein product [Protopolystoma xenopodis]|uniref:Rab-GAP TBC domain-containing protein n=1 Tax=Protopolystoma xenopodis TaxID=117903 RepID=A0A448WIP8_9PLAT|nr:unnamed protein product [Protopolystoma xenopodis]
MLSARLPDFFSTGGFTRGLRAYFNKLRRLLAFHLPRLAVRLTKLNTPLTGLTTGWVYTLFAHAMPLDKTQRLWDSLLAGPVSFPMFFYLAIFYQLDQQVHFESLSLESICTLLSNFPEFNLDRCRADALRFAVSTPVSFTLGPLGGSETSGKLAHVRPFVSSDSVAHAFSLHRSSLWPVPEVLFDSTDLIDLFLEDYAASEEEDVEVDGRRKQLKADADINMPDEAFSYKKVRMNSFQPLIASARFRREADMLECLSDPAVCLARHSDASQPDFPFAYCSSVTSTTNANTLSLQNIELAGMAVKPIEQGTRPDIQSNGYVSEHTVIVDQHTVTASQIFQALVILIEVHL